MQPFYLRFLLLIGQIILWHAGCLTGGLRALSSVERPSGAKHIEYAEAGDI